jgi:hypothetical protein
VERFAYPVLLERSRTAELAQRAHPVREDGPDLQTLAEVAAHAFGLRGQDYATATWDSWRGEDGKWVVQLYWYTGRSDNRAHWAFHPGAHGGTVTPMDEPAHDLMDPNPVNRPLRTVRPVTELARQALEAAPLVRGDSDFDDEPLIRQPTPQSRETVAREPVIIEPQPEPEILAADEIVPKPVPREPVRREPPVRTPEPVPVRTPEPVGELVREPEPERLIRQPAPKPTPEPELAPVAQVLDEPAPVVEEPARTEPKKAAAPAAKAAPAKTAEPAAKVEPATPEPTTVEQPATVEEPAAQVEPEPEPPAGPPPTPPRKTEPAAKRGKKNHPIVPSWEDVLLGVRTQRG